jgi:hypothetical protein
MSIALPAGPGQSTAEFAAPSPPPGLLGGQMQPQVVAGSILQILPHAQIFFRSHDTGMAQ